MKTMAGATNRATCVDEPTAISSVTSSLFRIAKNTADACSAALPMTGNEDQPQKDGRDLERLKRRVEGRNEQFRLEADQKRRAQQDAGRQCPRPFRSFAGRRRAKEMRVGELHEHQRRTVEDDEGRRNAGGDELAIAAGKAR
jgi:hypothetical protein